MRIIYFLRTEGALARPLLLKEGVSSFGSPKVLGSVFASLSQAL